MSYLNSDFVHLHVHTQYSLLDGAIRLNSLFKKTAEFGMNTVAITDHGTMFGVIDFYQKAKNAGIKPIIGCECYVAPRRLSDKTSLDAKRLSHLVLLAKDIIGYKNLCKLASIAQMKGFYYKPRIDKEIIKKFSGGLIALSACLGGEIPKLISENNIKEAEEVALFYQHIFGENNFFLEIQDNGIELQNRINQSLLEMSNKLSIPLVATNDCHYLDKSDNRAHDVLLCIQTGKIISDKSRLRFETNQLYFKSPKEMITSFKNYPGSLENTVKIADRCDIEFNFNKYHFPKFDSKLDKSIDEIFKNQVLKGFDIRMGRIKAKNPNVNEKIYNERLEYEISIIIKMGFPGYFLIVADFIRYGKENDIPVGPGRGSATGSIVAYAMNITDLDPIEHGLIFERFLNPARISMPDIDVDFCINGREKVFNYLTEKYGGGEYVSQIITFGKLKTKVVIRDVGRALNIPLKEVDTIAKMVPDVLGIKLKDALKMEPKFLELAEKKPKIKELISICKVLEGLPRHASIHAAGVVISDKPLVEYLPVFKGKNGEVVTQFDMKIVEKIGLIKFDLLGLKNLTVIQTCLKLIENQRKNLPDLIEVDYDDSETYKLLCSGDTTGVFQLESSGMKNLLIKLKPERFNDIIALVALYRPGPLDSGMVDSYVERKHGREKIKYIVPQLEELTKETYGVILYQEQVMKIASVLANYSMIEADSLRKAMGKKILTMMEEHRKLFMKGSLKNNIEEEKAKQIFYLMEKFGGYGFNKSHSAAYALICFQTAYLKAHFPVEFMAALLTNEMGNADGVIKFIAECKNHKIKILPPDINKSYKEFNVVENNIRFGLAAVKNVGDGAIESILEARKKGSFKSIFDFCERLPLQKINKRVIEALIKCGAFDSTGSRRSQIMASIEDALEYRQRVHKKKNNPQMYLFESNDRNKSEINAPSLPDIEEWENKQLLLFEKESLGFYVSGHPLNQFEKIINKFSTVNSININECNSFKAVRIGGIIAANKIILTKKGDKMSFATIEDLHGTIEVIIFSSLFERVKEILIEDQPVIVEGKTQIEEKSVKIMAEKIVLIEKAEKTWTKGIKIKLNTNYNKKEDLIELKNILEKYPGHSKVYIIIKQPNIVETIIETSDKNKITYHSLFKKEINDLLGSHSIETITQVPKIASQKNYNRKYKKK